MFYVNGIFLQGSQVVESTETIIHKDNISANCIVPDTITMDLVDDTHYKIKGPIKDCIIFVYNEVLHNPITTVQEAANDMREFRENMDIYFNNCW